MPVASQKFIVLSGLLVWLAGTLIGLNYLRLAWTLDGNGLSVMTGRLPYWDFTNLWGGGRLALQGNVGHLFDVEAYRPALRTLLSPLLLDQEWSYPPSMLLLGAPLAALPVFPAYLAWTGVTLALLLVVAGWLGLKGWQGLLLLAAPPVIFNVLFGQNGALTSSLLLGGLLLAPTRPLLGGLPLGLLTVKPHLGILVPFCLMVAGNYRAVASATVTGLAMVVLSGAVFGWETWPLFFSETNPMMRAILEAPYPQGYQMNAMTVFSLVRSLGAGLGTAYLVQGLFTAVAVAAVIWLWRGAMPVEHDVRVSITGLLALCATPYGYTYDAIPLAIAVLVLGRRQLVPMLLLAVGWLYPLMNHVVAMNYPSLGVLVPALMATASVWAVSRRNAGAENHPMAKLKASSERPSPPDDWSPSAGSGRRAGGSAGCSAAGSSD